MSGTKKRTLICILLIVLMIVIICYSGVRKYSSDITSREVASIEKQLDDLNGKSLGDDTRSYCHIKVIGSLETVAGFLEGLCRNSIKDNVAL